MVVTSIVKEKKITKTDKFNMAKEILSAAGREDLVEFMDEQIALIEKKADKAKERAAKKKEEVDVLRGIVLNTLTEEPQSIPEIIEQISEEDYPEVTKAKVVSRLNKLIAEGYVEKAQAKTDEGKRIVIYSLSVNSASPVEE